MIWKIRWWAYLRLKDLALFMCPPDMADMIRRLDDAQADAIEYWAAD